MQASFVQKGGAIDHTPVADVLAGQVVVQGSLVGVAERAISAGLLGAISVCGVFDIVKANGALAVGAKVYWDADGNPVNGVASSGAITATATDNTQTGIVVAAAAAGDETVRVLLTQNA